MQIDFQRTLRSLADERHGSGFCCAALLVLGALVVGWGCWLFLARIPVYEVSSAARIETSQRGHPVESVTAGRVVRIGARLGQYVRAGDVLFTLDDTAVAQRIKGATVELTAMSAQIETRRAEMKLTEQLIAARDAQNRVAMAQALARREQSQAALQHADFVASQQAKLLEKGVTTRSSYSQAQRDAAQIRAGEHSAALEIDRLKAQLELEQREIRIRYAEQRSRVAEMEASIARQQAELAALRKQLEDHQIRATAEGILGEVADIRPGGFVQAGTRLATIVPGGDLRVVAEFAPATAIGRVAVGQKAMLRLAGFPSAQYGTLSATVADVAGEIRNGTIRVELVLSARAVSPIPLQHGQPGVVEVAVGQASPFDMVVRNAASLIRPADTVVGAVRTAANGSGV